MKWFVTLLLSLVFVIGCAPSTVTFDPPALVYQGEYVLRARDEWMPFSLGLRSSTTYPKGTYILKELPSGGFVVSEGNSSLGISSASAVVPYDESKDLCKELSTEDVACSANFVMMAYITPNDPMFKQQWGYKRMESEAGWNKVRQADIKVCVIDTGVASHTDLQIAGGFNAIDESNNFLDDNGHGTHCSGTVCASGNNSLGVSGASWGCNLYGVKFLRQDGSGSLFHAVKAIDWSVQNGCKIISASWGGGGFSQPLYEALKRAREAGVLFIAAAGNDGRNTDVSPNYPSGYELDNVLSVAAIDRDGFLASFSNFGKETVDLAAPGVSILSTSKEGGYQTLSGTSMATPHVASVAALVWTQNPSWTYLQVKDKILSAVQLTAPLASKTFSGGELNANKSLESSPPVSPTPTPPCNERKLERCYNHCERAYPDNRPRRRKCRIDCRKRHHCERGFVEWVSEMHI